MSKLNLWDSPNKLVEGVYHKDNYKTVECLNTNLCYVFFSSNGIFFPNTVEEFENKIILKNRFEWENLAAGEVLYKNSGKQIFVRDIYKQWYIKGINSSINTIDALIELLRELTDGYDIITVGISSGGYMAALVGAKLNAKMCFDFSGQVNLYNFAENNPFLKIRKGDREVNKTQYYNIADIVNDSICQFYYFYAAECDYDKKEWELLANFENVHGFGFKSKSHAATMFVWNMPYILTKSIREMDDLCNSNKGKTITPLGFSIQTMPMKEACYYPIHKICKLVINKLRKK